MGSGIEGAGRRGLWSKVQRHARGRGEGWSTGVPGSEGGREEGAVEEGAAPC